MKKLIASTIVLSSVAQAGAYNFGGSCPSQGAWTQMALQQTQNISDVVRQLKDNPACKGIESVVGDIQAAAKALETSDSDEQQETFLEKLPSEVTALRSSIAKDRKKSGKASAMLMDRTLKAAKVSTTLSQSASLKNPVNGFAGDAIKQIFTRYAAPTKKGIELVSKVFQVLPQFDECLLGRPDQGMAIMGGAIKVAAAFSAAGEGVGDSLGNAVASLTTMLRDRRFTLALRKQDETQFWFSISCLLESTSKNFCDAEEAQELLEYSSDQYTEAMKRNLEGRKSADYDNPLEGYYLLVRELPMISSWLQQVQFGVTPKLAADAAYKNKIWDQVTDLTKTATQLTGFFNEQIQIMKDLPDAPSKRNQLFRIIQALVDNMTSGSNDATSGAQFFATTIDPNLLPFYLIGMDAIPEECLVSKNRMVARDWTSWMRNGGAGGSFQAQFKDPMKLAQIIESRMKDVIDAASQKSSAYFRQRLVVDMPNLVNQTLTGQYMTVRKAFENVYNYLVRFENKLDKDSLDVVMIPSVRETRSKIKKFLTSYDKLREIGKKTVTATTQTAEMNAAVNDAAREVIDTIFNEFNILFQKDTFLTNRLTTYIDKDFSNRIRAGINMTPYQQDLMVITQKHLLDKLTSTLGQDPTKAKGDLHQAQIINMRNLRTLEEVFQDSLYHSILEIKAVAEGGGATAVSAGLQKRFEEEKKELRKYAFKIPMPGGLLQNLGLWLFAGKPVKDSHPDLFGLPFDPMSVASTEDRFGSNAQFQAKLCAQTLGFRNRDDFYDICKGTVIKSYWKNKADLDLRYDDYMPYKGAGFANAKNAEVTSKNTCAYNNFMLKNTVQWLEDQDAEMYQDNVSF